MAEEVRLPGGGDVVPRGGSSSSAAAAAKRVISGGPVVERQCTDIVCLATLVLTWLVFITISFQGVGGGEPRKLYKPRDYRGDYCGVESAGQWESTANYAQFERLSYMMNVTGVVDRVAEELVCSSAAEEVLRRVMDQAGFDQYLCACCKSPCGSCRAAPRFHDSYSAEALVSVVASKMGDLTDPARAMELFSASGANGGAFGNLFHDMDQHFVPTCVKRCDYSGYNGTAKRRFVYSPPPDSPWKIAWTTLVADARLSSSVIQKTIAKVFEFEALPVEECSYDPRYCIPFPGISFDEGYGGYCRFQLASDIAGVMGDAVDKRGFNDLRRYTKESIGTAMGDVLETLDALAVVAICSCCYGLLCMVLLRFFIKVAVWGALAAVFAMLLAGGAATYVASEQCSGDSMVQAGRSYSAAWGLRYFGPGGVNVTAESFTDGAGGDYRGFQTQTETGRECQSWDSQSPHRHPQTSSHYPDAGLEANYCRNPDGAAAYIWCYTTDPATSWEFCRPLGAPPSAHDCLHGYAIKDESVRDALKGVALVVLALAAVWAVVVLCICQRIRLAIAINQVAAAFVFETPQILGVPMWQTVTALLWSMLWSYSAAFLLSQVPTNYVPTEPMTWAEATGAKDVPGNCTRGFVWRDLGDASLEWDECTGILGDVSGIEPRCWKCAPPRYIFDAKFALSLFTLLWNNELLIAIGVCVIAGACASWFFRASDRRANWADGQDAVMRATYNTFRFHLGSLAAGALFIAIVQFIRACLAYVEKQAERHKNQVMAIVMKALQCCMWCFETCLKVVSKNAYIQIALFGTPFFESAQAALCMLARNPIRFMLLGSFGNVIRFIGVAFVMAATVLTGFFVLQALSPEVSPLVPMAVFFFFSYMVAQAFLNVFALAVDSMLQCLVASEEMGLPPDRMPKPLRDLQAKRRVGKGAQYMVEDGHGGHDDGAVVAAVAAAAAGPTPEPSELPGKSVAAR